MNSLTMLMSMMRRIMDLRTIIIMSLRLMLE
jgi:hypothetical protein